jgi:cytochrome c-type biogenesis protein CcmH/NrfF
MKRCSWVTNDWQRAQGSAVLKFMLIAVVFLLPSRQFAQVFPPEVKKASEAFVCQCSCNHQLSACGMLNCGSATPLRTEIQEHLKGGKSQKEIVEAFVAKYGKVILAAPTTQGFDLAAWLTPFAALSLGLIVVYFVIKTWTRRKPALAGNASTRVIPDAYRDKMEKELKDLG